jgi:pSer/pThr/pTyr-binding forkhead associated (FHA) protein
LGRARNNDIVLLDSSISKLHAHFALESGGCALTDAGSRNGTKVNGQKLSSGKPETLRPGDALTIGRVDLLYLDAAGLYDLVSKLIQKRV